LLGTVRHDLLMVKLPLPLHPVLPLRVQVPVMVLPFPAPCRASWLFVPAERRGGNVHPKCSSNAALESAARGELEVGDANRSATSVE